jgi:hypothetical protein
MAHDTTHHGKYGVTSVAGTKYLFRFMTSKPRNRYVCTHEVTYSPYRELMGSDIMTSPPSVSLRATGSSVRRWLLPEKQCQSALVIVQPA